MANKFGDDGVNHPGHYTWHPSGVECKTIAREMSWNIGSAMAYLWRADFKGETIQDLEKAIFHIQDEIDRKKSQINENIQSLQDRGGWIEWRGGECPVARSAIVDVKFSNNQLFMSEKIYTYQARAINWDLVSGDGVAFYRLSDEQL